MQQPNTIQNQGVIMEVPQGVSVAGKNSEKLNGYKRVMRALGFVELVIGLICSILGVAVLSNAYGVAHYRKVAQDFYASSYFYFYHPYHSGPTYNIIYRYNFGEGLWGGLWIVVSGALGVAVGKKTLTRCLLNSRLAFAILGAVFSTALFSTSTFLAVVYSRSLQNYKYGVGIEIALSTLSFISLVLCIVSASFCCCAMPAVNGKGCCDCYQYEQPTGRVSYVVPNPTAASTSFQTHPFVLQTGIGIQPVPVATVQQHQQVPVVQQAVGMYQQPSSSHHQQQEEQKKSEKELRREERRTQRKQFHVEVGSPNPKKRESTITLEDLLDDEPPTYEFE